MAATPEVAMTLALLGTRLRRIGMVASAAWSKRLPSTDDRWLQNNEDTSARVRPRCLTHRYVQDTHLTPE